MSDFQIYESEIIKSRYRNISGFIDMVVSNPPQKEILVHQDYIKDGNEYTYNFNKYNVFGLLSTNKDIFDLYCELNAIVYDFLDDQEVEYNQVWMQSWLNYHDSSELLDWHDHKWPYHGYITIRPHDTTTIFRDVEIINEVGNVYIGKGYREHCVKLNSEEQFDLNRITLGFDIDIDPSSGSSFDRYRLSHNIGLIPFPRIQYK